MIPVDQTIEHDPVNGQMGDCFRACVASLLELPIEEVPHFTGVSRRETWFSDFTLWLEDRGMSAVFINIEKIQEMIDEPTLVAGDGGIAIAGGISNSSLNSHAVLWSFDCGGRGRMIHDPSPSRRGIREIRDLTFITKGAVDAKKEEKSRSTQDDAA